MATKKLTISISEYTVPKGSSNMQYKNKLNFLLMPLILMTASCVHYVPAIYNTEREYHLPYSKGDSRLLIQGPNGIFSHRGRGFEFDFLMPINTPILAAKGGVVLAVEDSFGKRCPLTKNCNVNFVAIQHGDGSIGRYLHINQYSACVPSTQNIEQGDIIALSGNVGVSLLPHLHFEVLWPKAVEANPPSFIEVDHRGSGVPKTGRRYVSANAIKIDHCKTLSRP